MHIPADVIRVTDENGEPVRIGDLDYMQLLELASAFFQVLESQWLKSRMH